MAHARRSPQHRAPSSSISSPSLTRRNTLRRSTSRTSSHTSSYSVSSPTPRALRPVLVPLQSNLRRLPSRIHLSQKDNEFDQLMRDSSHVITGTKRKRTASTNENAHTNGRPTRASGRTKRQRTTSRYRRPSTSDESASEPSEMEVDTPFDGVVEADTDNSDAGEDRATGSDEDNGETHNSPDDFLIETAPHKALLRLLKPKLVEIYELCGLTGDAETFTKQELADAIVNNRDDHASVPPSSPPGKYDAASSDYSSDDGHIAGGEETDAGRPRPPSHISPLRRRVTVHDLGAASARPVKSRSLSMGNLVGHGEASKTLLSKRKASMQLDANRAEPVGVRRKLSAQNSPSTSTATSSVKLSPPTTRLRSRIASTSIPHTNQPEASSSKIKAKGKAKQVEFSNEVEVHLQTPSKRTSKGKEPETVIDSESDLTELEDDEDESEPIGMPSPRRLRSKDRDAEKTTTTFLQEDPDVTPVPLSKQRKRVRNLDPERTKGAHDETSRRALRITPMRKAKSKVGSLRESEEEEEQEEETEQNIEGNEDEEEEEAEEEVDELVSSASMTPPDSIGRRTPVRRRLRPRRSRNKVAPSVDEENEGDDEDEEGEEERIDDEDGEEEEGQGDEDEDENADDEGEGEAEEGEEVEDEDEENEGEEEDDDEVTIAVEPRKLRNGKIVGEEDVEMEVEEEPLGEEDGEGDEAAEEEDDAQSIDVDAEPDEDEDETMEDDVDLTVATAKTLVRLRRDDLVRLCETRALDPSGTKPQLAEALLQWRDRQGNDFSSPSSGGTVRPSSKSSKKRRTKRRSATTSASTPVLFRSEQQHTDEPRTPIPTKDKDNEELELDLESLGLEDREIPPEKLTKLEKIGSGGFKDVFIGKFKGRKIAISEFRGQLSAMDIKELKLLGAFNHPNIVRFLGVSIPENTKETPVMIVSELCSNGDLFDYIRNTNAPTMHKVLQMMHDIARGLEYLHTRKPSIIHRDCKSSNILITAKGTAKIADFGLAKVKQSTRSMVRSLVGTVNWQAPELWTAHPKYNHKVDAFSCAMVYWEMLQWHAQTKKFPWEGMNEHAIYEIVGTKRQRPSISGLRKLWCSDIVDLVERMWAQEPQDRPTMTEVVEALEEMLTRY